MSSFSGYSERHDKGKSTKQPKKPSRVPSVGNNGIPPVDLPSILEPTDEERRSRREAALKDKDTSVKNTNGAQGNQFVGSTPSPEVMGRQPGRKPRVLDDPDLLDSPRIHDEDSDLSLAQRSASEFSGEKPSQKALLDLDRTLSEFYVLVLKMKKQVKDAKEGNKGSQKLAQNLIEIETALVSGIEPWFQHIDGLLVGE